MNIHYDRELVAVEFTDRKIWCIMKKRKIIVLIVSIVIVFLILGIGIYGLASTRRADRKQTEVKAEKESGSEGLENSKNQDSEEDSNKENESEDSSKDSEQMSQTQESSTDQSQESGQQETTSGNQSDLIVNSGISRNIDPTKPMVALTFDDGPSRQNTPVILDALKQYGGHATFFVVGYNIDGNEDIIKRICDEGSEVANHTASHAKLTDYDAAGIMSEVGSVSDRIKSITGQSNVLLRPPFGAVDDNVMANITDPVILWSIDTEDWKSRNTESVIQNIQSSVFDGAIVLMHDLYPETAAAATAAIEWLTAQGYQLVTVSELGYYRRGGLKLGVRYGSLQPN